MKKIYCCICMEYTDIACHCDDEEYEDYYKCPYCYAQEVLNNK